MLSLSKSTETSPTSPAKASGTRSKLFSDLFKTDGAVLKDRPPEKSSFKGCPSISFSKEDVEVFSRRFRFALIGRFRRRPPLSVVRSFLTRLGLVGGFTVGELNSNAVLINFEQDEDYQRFFLRKTWTLGRDIMVVTKWSPNLRPEEDSPIVPVWITIPNLPIHFHDQKALFCITSALGKPLKVDNATLNFAKPKAARVCIEVDVSKSLHQRIHVRHVDEDLFFQVLYEDPPSFCSSCHRLGHTSLSCKPDKLQDKPVVESIPPMKDKGKGVSNDWTTIHRKGKSLKAKVTWVQKPTTLQETPCMPCHEDTPCMPCHEETSKAGARRRPQVHFMGSKEVLFLDTNGLAHSSCDPSIPVVEPTSEQNVSLDLENSCTSDPTSGHIGMDLPLCDLQVDIPVKKTSSSAPPTPQRIRTRSDYKRVFYNAGWADQWDTLSLHHLAKGGSDHCPILFSSKPGVRDGPKSFRFQNMWLLRDDFIQFCKDSWEEVLVFGGMRCLFNKLHHLKAKLSSWNKDQFGNVFDMVKEAEEEASKAEILFEENPSSENKILYNQKKAQLIELTNREYTFWKQKCNLKWLQEGDANTRFFHNLVRSRRRQQRINLLVNDDGNIIDKPEEMEKLAVHHYTNLLNQAEPTASPDIYRHFLDAIPSLIDHRQNDYLMCLPTEEEIKLIIWEMDPNSAAGPDGFNITFLKCCWDFIKTDVVSACQEVFLGLPLPQAVVSANICLLLKVENARKLHDFRPICLSTVASKIATKCIAKRLSTILPLIISEEQAAYVPRRDILDQILITKEMAHHINRKAHGGNLIIKLDMAKAFDKLRWSYLFDILKSFGFSSSFIHMVNNLLSSSKYSVLFNGKPCGYFGQSRGVKQGDPLSPLLFIIASEGFSRNLNKLFIDGLIDRFNCGRNFISISHLSYADDIIIFTSGNSRSIHNLKSFLHNYQLVSGQTINYGKSNFMSGSKINSLTITKLERLLMMPHKSFPFTYLGVPIDLGITRKSHCSHLIQSFDNKLNGWFQKNLDQAGRLVLIKHVLNTLPNYFLAANTIPKAISHLLEQKMARFWWGGGASKHHWISWEKMCYPMEEGGLGIRDLRSLEKAFSLKLWWKFYQDSGLWARFMRAKYWRDGDIFETITDSPVWKRISRVEETASNACNFNEDGSMVWSPEANGSFSLKSAFDLCRPSTSTVASFKYLWMKPQNRKVGVFTWKLFKRCLPIPENLQRLGFHLPSICPFCMADSFSSKHVFIDCPRIEEVWKFFSACLGILHSPSSSINQHFMNWWLRGNNNNIYGFLRLHLPGIICWHIWKELNALLHENKAAFTSSTLIDSISRFVRQWLNAKSPKKLRIADPWLAANQLLPSFPQGPRIRVVKWLAPPRGRLKLNIDASFTPMAKRGAAILRDDEGRFVRAASFLISGSTPYQAEPRD
ncbi:unnamed protein product [Cuscuta campestris]|uniref:Reverse transcriptase domain-containing protein n=1 Tax=Cuscuta campestris TaxID=132261 RepID=A0A484MQ44_9ASTE|nr:unnamed protein product [Cuscuta campestris]